MSCPISERLKLAASLVREGAYLADIGTDHAYLAIHLFETGKISRAVLADINRGPLARAEENIKASGFGERCTLVLSDGARELSSYPVSDFAVLGMGGELIADIISAAPMMKKEGVRLILGPMTRTEAVRRALFDLGFKISGEYFVTDAGKHYVTLLAEYTGESEPYSEADLYFGKRESFAREDKEMAAYMQQQRRRLLSVISGKEIGGSDATAERALLVELDERMKVV